MTCVRVRRRDAGGVPKPENLIQITWYSSHVMQVDRVNSWNRQGVMQGLLCSHCGGHSADLMLLVKVAGGAESDR